MFVVYYIVKCLKELLNLKMSDVNYLFNVGNILGNQMVSVRYYLRLLIRYVFNE